MCVYCLFIRFNFLGSCKKKCANLSGRRCVTMRRFFLHEPITYIFDRYTHLPTPLQNEPVQSAGASPRFSGLSNSLALGVAFFHSHFLHVDIPNASHNRRFLCSECVRKGFTLVRLKKKIDFFIWPERKHRFFSVHSPEAPRSIKSHLGCTISPKYLVGTTKYVFNFFFNE